MPALCSRDSTCTGAGDEALRTGRRPVCADRWAAVVPAGDPQAVARSAVAGAGVGCGWRLAAGTRSGAGDHCGAGAVPGGAVAALGARADPGPPGPTLSSCSPTGAGSRGAGNGGECPVAVAASQDGST